MPIALSLVAVLSGGVAVAIAGFAGWPWYLLVLLYPFAGSLAAGGVIAALVICGMRRRPHEAQQNV